MDRGAWQATVMWSQRAGHELATTHIVLDQGSAYCFYEGTNSKYFRFSIPDDQMVSVSKLFSSARVA